MSQSIYLLTKRDRIRSVSKRWQHVHYHHDDQHKIDISNALQDLDLELATEEDISNIIGNKGWTDIGCTICEGKVDECIEVGDESVCFNCVDKMQAEKSRFLENLK